MPIDSTSGSSPVDRPSAFQTGKQEEVKAPNLAKAAEGSVPTSDTVAPASVSKIQARYGKAVGQANLVHTAGLQAIQAQAKIRKGGES